MNLSKIRNTAAQIAAAAIFESFPSVELGKAGETSVGFSCELLFPHPINPEFHFQIEEKMRQIIREKREIRDLEMVPFSARELMKSQGLSIHREELRGEGLVRIVRIGSFCNLSSGKHLNNSSELVAFKVFPPEILSDGSGIRVSGVAYGSKGELKDFLKKWTVYPEIRHERAGEVMGLWRLLNEGFLWLPKGLILREKLLCFLKKNLVPESFEISIPRSGERSELLKILMNEKPTTSFLEVLFRQAEEPEGLFEPHEGSEIEICSSIGKSSSFLQSIAKTLNILGFGYCTRLVGRKRKDRAFETLARALDELAWPYEVALEEEVESPQVQFLVADGLGRMWSCATVQIKKILICRLSLERNIALLLEMQVPLPMNFEERIKRLENQ